MKIIKKSMDQLDHMLREGGGRVPGYSILLILDSVRSMHNVGAAFRTADAMGVEAIYLCGYTPRPPHRDIHKTALGATETVKWKGFERVDQALTECRHMGYSLFGVEQTSPSILLQDFEPASRNIALVFGNEVEGISEQALEYLEACIEIPQFGKKHSLNLSISMGMVLWELNGRRARPSTP